jgi:Ca-activated chloride channel family protein
MNRMIISSGMPMGITAPSGAGWKLANSTTLALCAAVCAGSLAVAHVQFSSGVSVVEVYATVTDEKGELVKGLTAGDFQLREDGAPQIISAFAAGDFPLNVALALDRSFSMAGERLATTKKAAHTFVDALRPDDRVRIVKIGSTFELADSRTEQHAAIDELDAWGTTALHDSIVGALDVIERDGPARGRHALVLFSDGGDRYSGASAADVVARARRGNVIVFPIAIGRERPELFAELASITGGRSFHLRDGEGLPDAVQTIARELRFQYLLGYAPSRPIAGEKGEWRSIAVKVDRPGTRVRARDGYLVR